MIRKGVYLLFLVPAQIAFAQEEDARIVQYTEESFSEGDKSHPCYSMYHNSNLNDATRFYWKHLHKYYNRYNHDHLKLKSIDCTTHESICIREHITYFPTFKLFIDGERKRITYHGKQELATTIAFIDEQLMNEQIISVLLTVMHENSGMTT
ncbi:thioredoxin domain-containing protein 5-like [Cephus cinctus]|uniref:Thioredoxin domain-containing protein 5-like n=1 Tax=Cephus cinctus TaxID=211228 RepID=A0AAJ7CGB8_CEPCN|nr:thioredoxin domain-containing protein 5-like [Cephus cinctus]